MSILPKKVLSVAPVKIFFLLGSNISDFVFENVGFREIKDHSLRATLFEKSFLVWKVLGICLPYVKRYFPQHQ